MSSGFGAAIGNGKFHIALSNLAKKGCVWAQEFEAELSRLDREGYELTGYDELEGEYPIRVPGSAKRK